MDGIALKPYYQDEFTTLYCGDVREILPLLPAEIVQCCVTSPPYYGLRQYFFDGAVQLKSGISEGDRETVLTELRRLGVEPKN